MGEREVEKIPIAQSCDKRESATEPISPNAELDTPKEADVANEVLK